MVDALGMIKKHFASPHLLDVSLPVRKCKNKNRYLCFSTFTIFYFKSITCCSQCDNHLLELPQADCRTGKHASFSRDLFRELNLMLIKHTLLSSVHKKKTILLQVNVNINVDRKIGPCKGMKKLWQISDGIMWQILYENAVFTHMSASCVCFYRSTRCNNLTTTLTHKIVF